jgi:DNA-binding transcriptional MerR regulator
MAIKTYSIEMLSAETGIAARTLRSWVGHRVLPKPAGKTRAARYDENHVLRARVIQRLRERGDPLTVIRRIIAPLARSAQVALAPAHECCRGERGGAAPGTARGELSIFGVGDGGAHARHGADGEG